MSETNGGNGNSRLDRIEKMLESHGRMMVDHDLAIAAINETIARAERANEIARERFEAARERFEEEDKRLLTAQILMNGAMQKMALAMEETTGKLDALINTVDGIIRPKHPS